MNRLGLESTACTGVVKGNADLYGEGQYEGQPPTADGHAAPLPVYPQPSDLPNPKVEALIDTAGVVLVAGAAFLLGVLL